MAEWGPDTVVRLLGYTARFRLQGDVDEWEKYLLDLANRAVNLQPVFERYGAYVLESVERNFVAEGRPERWAALSPLYAQRKARRWPGKGILTASGAMRAGFSFTATPRTLKITNSRPYWKYHQTGTKVMPRRVILILQDADKAVFTRWVREYLRTGEL